MAVLLGIRGYGYYIDDQADFLLHAKSLADTGRLIQTVAGFGEIPGNFHPPLMLLLLGALTKATPLLLAPALYQLLCAFATLFLLLRIPGRDPSTPPDGKQRFHLALLFFLLPFTHLGFLFLDIDNSLLPAWGALFILALTADEERRPRYHVLLGLAFAAGFWCKLTTPLAVLLVWMGLSLLRRSDWRAILWTLSVPLVACAAFLPTYALVCLAMDLPFQYPFQLTFSKFFGGVTESAEIGARLGNGLRSVYWDLHWFSAVTLAIAVCKTVADLRSFTWRRENLPGLYPMVFFWALYIGYTWVIPTLWLPRYKFGLLPFLFWWLRDDFARFAATLSPGRIAMLAGAGILASLALPDMATSAFFHEIRFHSLSPLAPALAGLPYYPESLTYGLDRLGSWSRGGVLEAPVSALLFLHHYLTWVGMALVALPLAALALIRLKVKPVLHGLLVLALMAWACRLAQNMRREYSLFYCSGTTGFGEMRDAMDSRLGPDEPFLGRKDFGLYTGRPFHQLYRYGDRGMEIDTAHLDSLLSTRPIRYLVYLEGSLFAGPGFQNYLRGHFLEEYRAGDYVLWRKRQATEAGEAGLSTD